MKEILQYLKKHGEQLDTEIAKAVGISLAKVRLHLSELAAKGEVMSCHSIRFENGKKIEGIRCRLAGYIPPLTPGRKPKLY
jgi:predicted ArsR family transcriptional regulator